MAGRIAEAAAPLEKAVTLDPNYADAWNNLGIVRRAVGDFPAARTALERAAALKPGFAPTHNALGSVLKAMGDRDGALAAFRRAVEFKPDYAEALTNLGLALLDEGRAADALSPLLKAAELAPARGEVWLNLGLAQRGCGKAKEAIASFQRAVAATPALAPAWNALGSALAKEDDHRNASEAFQRAAALEPRDATILSNYGLSLSKAGRDADALAVLERAVAADPKNGDALFNRGVVRQQLGDFAGAFADWKATIAVDPDNRDARSNLIFSMQYEDAVTGEDLLRAARDYDRIHGHPRERFTGWPNPREPERRLRVGYVSPDFREHSVAHYVEPLFAAHDRSAVELFAYAQVERPDAVTRRIQALVENWRATSGVDALSVARQIHADGIDILVDLAGHSAKNRLAVFALKPSPIQATWLGFPGTTGLSAIDYRLTDVVADPPGAEADSSEAIWRLPRGFHCWRPPVADIPPARDGASPVFGSFNNIQKLSPATIALWARILRRVPEARLVLKSHWLSRPVAAEGIRRAFADAGITPARLELSAFVPDVGSHLAAYRQIDVALDPFPYNGTTTTLEALWMGVPVIALRGERHAARVGASLLTQFGAVEWIAETQDAYVETVVALISDRTRLAEGRRALRARLTASPVCDRAVFARDLESAYRAMWRRWCGVGAP
jgi:predicted O-linked N-acetylglucosamine transferase (SPINDLY family)